MLARCIDFETTGEPTEDDPHAVVEVGWTDLAIEGDEILVREVNSTFCNPLRPIDPEAMAVHHITNADVDDYDPPTAALARLMQGPPDLFVAHNADFERHFFGGGEVRWICTYKVALRLWPDAPSHSMQALRYFLNLDLDRFLASPAHRAGPDSYVNAVLFAEILKRADVDVETMVRWSSGPALLSRIRFGKHKGARWADLPTDYLRWMVEKSTDLDRDSLANARYYLRQRGKG